MGVEQIGRQAESSSTAKAKGKQLQPGRDHSWQLQWQESAKGRPEQQQQSRTRMRRETHKISEYLAVEKAESVCLVPTGSPRFAVRSPVLNVGLGVIYMSSSDWVNLYSQHHQDFKGFEKIPTNSAGLRLAPPAEGANDGSLQEPKMMRENWRKKKELEVQRKLGNAPAEVDEEVKDINPHIPQYISSVPWYIDPSKRPTLKHQRLQPEKQKQYSSSGDWYKRGLQEHSVATRYRKGACENCGALTHKKKNCMERPRKVGAKCTGMNIAPDEHVQPQLTFDYSGKRDRWNGYNPEEHMKTVEEYSKVDLAKHSLKAQKLQEELASGMLEQTKRECNSEDEHKYADDIDMPGQNFDSKRRITVRNLRIREDIAKYLRNLDPNSAYYDPKTRAMRENPYANIGKDPDEVSYAGDNFIRYTGDTISMAQAQLFAWEAYDKGSEVLLQADPTKLELLYKSFKVKKEDFKAQQKESILENSVLFTKDWIQQKLSFVCECDSKSQGLLMMDPESQISGMDEGHCLHSSGRVPPPPVLLNSLQPLSQEVPWSPLMSQQQHCAADSEELRYRKNEMFEPSQILAQTVPVSISLSTDQHGAVAQPTGPLNERTQERTPSPVTFTPMAAVAVCTPWFQRLETAHLQMDRAAVRDISLSVVEVVEVGHDDRDRQGNGEHTSNGTQGAHNLATNGHGIHVPIAHGGHGHHRPPESIRDAGEQRVRVISLCKVDSAGEEDHPDEEEEDEEAQLPHAGLESLP
ncbi:hypothetical protein IHE44_0011972 [Lamprotornis superbus]|uniref:Pre-mRNA-splicing factor SLU7 n=1 Tax=Lamprotornis superbus TaxID=245042 RepID=A0A835NGE2_9PASS|nr:hypothetical protein IHE44_0011972 [Lamprotornis superbus]